MGIPTVLSNRRTELSIITEIAACCGDAIMRRCEDPADFDLRVGQAAVRAGVAGGVVSEARARGDLPGFVAAGAGRAGRPRGAVDRVLCADAYGDAADPGIAGTDSCGKSEGTFVRLRAVRTAGRRKLARAGSAKPHWRRI